MDKDDGIMQLAILSAKYIKRLRIRQLVPPEEYVPDEPSLEPSDEVDENLG